MSREAVEVLTFGCRLNIVESDAMRAEALAAGHDDLVIVNTCAVTAEATRQARQAIRRARRTRPESKIVVTGCAAEIDGPGFAAMPEVDAMVGNAQKTAPGSWARPGLPRKTQADGGRAASHTRGFVEIQNGCDHRCTFCVIPFGRGASRSVPPEAVVSTVRSLVEAGTREAVLTGVDITSYDGDGTNLGGLVKRLLRDVPGLERLRLSSIDCIEADPDLVDAVATEPRLMPHLHLSLQSGADLILKRMKRRHNRAEALALCRRLRRLRPEMVFGADLIVGFPTETEAHFAETLQLVEDCGLTYVHAFPYSPRPGTPAARMPAVPGETVKHRAARLRAAGDAALRRHLDAQVGRTLQVLSERGGRGRAEDFTAVRLGDVAPNQMLRRADRRPRRARAAGLSGRAGTRPVLAAITPSSC